uniref:Uncharacterized protein n=1 Tax=Ralstonia solanacearum TaxID=305 RepID=A0A0S4VAT8_RALSL|nr:conserved protein of unknown function [Ralstonia solanacearum]CUV31454.1 conserved protein of unknown function [Ralstonia solanacearum]
MNIGPLLSPPRFEPVHPVTPAEAVAVCTSRGNPPLETLPAPRAAGRQAVGRSEQMAFTVSPHWREPGIPDMLEQDVGPRIGKGSQKDVSSLKNDPNGRRLRFDNRNAAQDQHGGRRSPVPGRAIQRHAHRRPAGRHHRQPEKHAGTVKALREVVLATSLSSNNDDHPPCSRIGIRPAITPPYLRMAARGTGEPTSRIDKCFGSHPAPWP